MPAWMIILLFIVSGILNFIIIAVLISRNTISQRLMKEIHSYTQNTINELDKHVVLAETTKEELQLVLEQAQSISTKTKSKKTNAITTSTKQAPSTQTNKDIIKNIQGLLVQGVSEDQIIELLHVSYAEINIAQLELAK